MHRIPHGLTGVSLGKAAFVQHGILSSSADFCLLGRGKALGKDFNYLTFIIFKCMSHIEILNDLITCSHVNPLFNFYLKPTMWILNNA